MFPGAEDTLPAEHQSAMRLEDDFSVGREEASRAVGAVAGDIGTMDFGVVIIFFQVGGGGEGDGDGMATHIIPTATATDTTITTTPVMIPMVQGIPTVQGTATIPANRDR